MQANIKNRTIFCHDNLDVLRGMNSECVDLIYLDPPFNKKKEFTAPIGSSAEGASFKDFFREEDVKDEWLQDIREDFPPIHDFLMGIKNLSNIIDGRKTKHYLYNYCYLAYMARRLIEMQRVLKSTGSLYLHCDPTMSHYLKILLDIIFGEKNFRNEIVWCYAGGGVPQKDFPRKHDIILRLAKGRDVMFRTEYKPYGPHNKTGKRATTLGGKRTLKYREEGTPVNDWWADISPVINWDSENVGYPTQKPLALLERLIKASCPEEGLVLDPFCGCATTCVAAEKLGRKWVGIDVSVKAYELVKVRLAREVKGESESLMNWEKEIVYTTTPPKRTDLGEDYRLKKYVYVISNPSYPGEYKVGVATNMKLRLNSYQTSDPNREFKVEHTLLTPHFRAIEDMVHEEFSNKHEWVQAKLEDIVSFIEEVHEEMKGD